MPSTQVCYNDGLTGEVCFDPVTVNFSDTTPFTVTAKHLADGQSPIAYYTVGRTAGSSPTVWTGGLIPSTSSGDNWQEMTLVFCVYPVVHDDDKIFIFGSDQSQFTVATNDSAGGLWLAAKDAGTNVIQTVTLTSGLAIDQWHSVMISAVNYTPSTPMVFVEIWIDGVEVYSGNWDTLGPGFNPMDYNGPCYVGAGDYPFGSPDFWEGLNCYLAYVWCKEEYLDPNTYWDSFFDSNNRPKDVGADGSSVTGSPPDSYFPDADFTNNRGTGPDWTEIGTVATAPSSPTD